MGKMKSIHYILLIGLVASSTNLYGPIRSKPNPKTATTSKFIADREVTLMGNVTGNMTWPSVSTLGGTILTPGFEYPIKVSWLPRCSNPPAPVYYSEGYIRAMCQKYDLFGPETRQVTATSMPEHVVATHEEPRPTTTPAGAVVARPITPTVRQATPELLAPALLLSVYNQHATPSQPAIEFTHKRWIVRAK